MDEIEEIMSTELIEFGERWHNVDGIIKERSAEQRLSYGKERNRLLAKHKEESAAIEVYVVEIGL